MKWIVEYFYCYNSNEMYCLFMNMFIILTQLNNIYATKPYGYDFYRPYEFPIRMIKIRNPILSGSQAMKTKILKP